MSGLGKRVGDADSVRGGTGALIGKLGTHAFVFPVPNTLGAFSTAVGFASGVSARRVCAFGRFVHTLGREAVAVCVASFLVIAAIGYVVDLACTFIVRVRTIGWSY